ncbi:MAG: class I SAM-dependent methyltransferase [Phascolarctobacterium sp.]|nr:class I SAM-dependent methyltransferase [Phascolarctobacterium sp.]
MSIELKQRIENYWNNRASDFKNQSIAEMKNERYDDWLEIINKYIPKQKKLRVLDIGTGAGYMAMLLASQGHIVTGVDLCANMISAAKEASSLLDLQCDFMQQDAEKLSFPEEYFDVIITRNLTWTLINVSEDYKLWFSFLKQNGVLINFDADYGQSTFGARLKPSATPQPTLPPKNNLHGNLSSETLAECNAIKSVLEISQHRRPGWDVNILRECGFKNIYLEFNLHKNVPFRQGGMFGIFAYK